MLDDGQKTSIQAVVASFDFQGKVIRYHSFGNGHINDTFIIECENEKKEIIRYIMQRINTGIFKEPYHLMENIKNVTGFLKEKIIREGGNPDRETLNLILTKKGETYCKDESGGFWRAYLFIENAVCYETVKTPDDFYQSALAFGHFQRMLSDYPAQTLYETIKDFHNTPVRLQNLKKAVEEDVCKRASSVQKEISFACAREKDTGILTGMLQRGELPLRVTHNDTKLNNIMMDKNTGKGICIIDLDTVMPGLSAYDFGDSIRFGANTGEEDERDLKKISLSLELFDVYTKGFIEGCDGSLTEKELDMLPMGAKMMTYECGIRFLADYLQDDIYFKIDRDGQNLDRCRTQFALVADMEKKWDEMHKIVNRYRM